MQINELYIRNFGKFSEKRFYLDSGIHVFYGENEYGKSTIYAFIKAMLFGMERGRGRAALNDEFSHYEPWNNPNYYSGMMRFTSGGKHFVLERNFDRYTKSASLICEDDGEELSVEDGDLQMLLGGLTKESFENTVAIGQLSAKPGQALAKELKNCAANYYETGSGTIDLTHALNVLDEQKKNTEKELRKLRTSNEEKMNIVKQESAYVQADAGKLEQDFKDTGERLKMLKSQNVHKVPEPEEEISGDPDLGRNLLKMGVFGLLAGAAGTFWGRLASNETGFNGIILISSLVILIGALLIAAGIKKCFDSRKNRNINLPSKEIHTEKDEELREEQQRLSAVSKRIQEDWKEKQVRFQNLQEQLAELAVPGEQEEKLRFKIQALELAKERMQESAEGVTKGFGNMLNQKASEILEIITDGKYSRLFIDEDLNMTLLENGRKISIDRVSCGTIEQIYFSLRMAAAQILDEEPVPVIFDEAFAFYDTKRLKSTLKWLREQERQVIIFSCQRRETEIVKQF